MIGVVHRSNVQTKALRDLDASHRGRSAFAVVFESDRSQGNPPQTRAHSQWLVCYLATQPGKHSLPQDAGIKTIVDLRPDGEAQDQVPSAEIEAAAKRDHIAFHYIPIPHEGIPDAAVEALDDALSPQAVPAVLYCRTGRRAVRTFAMVEASRSNGPGVDAIVEMVRAAGFSAEDLKDDLTRRISRRKNPEPVAN